MLGIEHVGQVAGGRSSIFLLLRISRDPDHRVVLRADGKPSSTRDKPARSKHPGGVNAGMADGSVRFIKNSVNVFTFRSLSTTKGNEVISSDAY